MAFSCVDKLEVMTRSRAQMRTVENAGNASRFVWFLAAAAVALGGCAVQKKPAIAWRTAVLVRPLAPAGLGETEDATDPPDLAFEIPADFAPLAVARSAPARPRVPAPAVARDVEPPAKPDTPQIVPELTAQESTALKKETEQSLGTAEHNIAASAGKRLNTTQLDLASKVRSFMADARAAGQAGDWPRARDLAKKAQVLSAELASSL